MLIALALLAPLLLAALSGLAGCLPPRPAERARRATALLAPAAVLPAVLLSVAGEAGALHVDWMLYGAVVGIDAVARPLVLVAAVIYGAALMSVAWVGTGSASSRSPALCAFLLVAFAGNIGVCLAQDALTFYLAFAVMSFSAAGLVIHTRSRTAWRPTVVYLVMTVISETAILAALLLIVAQGGLLLADAPAAAAAGPPALIGTLLLIGFGVKAGTLPLHVWLPLAHPAAPPPGSAVLSGAMVKAGVVGWLRFMPSPEAAPSAADALGAVLLGLGLGGALLAPLAGVLQNDPKVVLAYSTISQLGFITCVVAIALLEPELSPAASAVAVIYAVHHGLAKGALFLGVGVMAHAGPGPVRVLLTAGMITAGLAIAGAPLTSGALAKYLTKEIAEDVTVLGPGLDSWLTLVAIGSTVLLLRFAHLLRRQERRPQESIRGELLGWLLTVIAALGLPWLITHRWTAEELPSWDAESLWSLTWPVLAGAALAGMIRLLAARGKLGRWPARAQGTLIPPGDLLVPAEHLGRRLGRAGRALLSGPRRVAEPLRRRCTELAGSAAGAGRRMLAIGETGTRSWEGSGAAILVLILVTVIALLAVWGWSR